MWDRLFKKKLRWSINGSGKPRLDEFPAPASNDDEWAFLRQQPDYDADEMANVRRVEGEHAGAGAALATAAPEEPATPPIGLDGPALPKRILDPPPAILDRAHRRVLALRIQGVDGEWVRRLDGELLIGRNPEGGSGRAEIDLAGDMGVDARHALILTTNGQFLLRDLHSAGGTHLNGHRMDPEADAWLKPGDEILVGVRSRIQVTEAPADPNLSNEDLLLSDMLRSAFGAEEQPEDSEAASLAGELDDQFESGPQTAYAAPVSAGTPERERVPAGKAAHSVVRTSGPERNHYPAPRTHRRGGRR